MTSFEAGEAFGAALFVFFIVANSVRLVLRGLRQATASMRSADISLALGLLVFVQPAVVMKGLGSPPLWILMAGGAVRGLLAVAALVMAVMAGLARGDGGASRVRVVMAGLLAFWLGIIGMGEITAPVLLSAKNVRASKRLTEGGARMHRIVKDARGRWESTARTFAAAGGVSPGSMASPEAVDERLAVADEAIEAAAAFLATMEGLPPQIEEYLRRDGHDETGIRDFERGYLSSERVKANHAYVTKHRKLLEAQREMLLLMREGWGHWSQDAAAQVVELDGDPSVSSWNDKAQAIDALAEELRALDRAAKAGATAAAGS